MFRIGAYGPVEMPVWDSVLRPQSENRIVARHSMAARADYLGSIQEQYRQKSGFCLAVKTVQEPVPCNWIGSLCSG